MTDFDNNSSRPPGAPSEGLRQEPVFNREGLDSGGGDVPGDPRSPVRAVRCRSARREAHAPNRLDLAAASTEESSRRHSCATKSEGAEPAQIRPRRSVSSQATAPRGSLVRRLEEIAASRYRRPPVSSWTCGIRRRSLTGSRRTARVNYLAAGTVEDLRELDRPAEFIRQHADPRPWSTRPTSMA